MMNDAVFYHIYPLGLCDAPTRNDFTLEPVPRLAQLHDWVDHLCDLGINAVYLGPVFESTAHGYDTVDYLKVDRRLGTEETLRDVIQHMKQRGIRVIFDAVFNHVGRDFWAFQDVLKHGAQSAYCGWFINLNFEGTSPYGDPFSYEGWAGHYDLVKLNLKHPDVIAYLAHVVETWINIYGIDGLRLDAADVMDHDFFRVLQRPDFWLMGEVVHGDYRHWLDKLDSVTNYECFKGLYSSHVDCNYFEIAYSLNRQFGEGGIYQNRMLYNFVDNHDVNRIASNLTQASHLYAVYGLLFTIPGIPSIYYGSEWGITGERTPHHDRMLRPALNIHDAKPNPALAQAIKRMIQVRQTLPALRYGDYEQLHINHEQFVFKRHYEGQTVIVAVNASDSMVTLNLNQPHTLIDRLNNGETFAPHAAIPLHPSWLRIMEVK